MRSIFLSLIPILYFSIQVNAKPKYSDFTREIEITGVGKIKVEYVYHGEPVSRPADLIFWKKCAKDQRWQPVGKYQMCELTDFSLDPKEKKISIRYLEGRVAQDTGVMKCDQFGEGEIDAKTLCK